MPKGKKEEVGEVFAVEVILAAKVVAVDSPKQKKRKRKSKKAEAEESDLDWQYLVKWAGYPDDEATWEPVENLGSGCDRLLRSFWEAVGTDDEDYLEDHTVYPPDDWIKREKERFSKGLDKENKNKKKGPKPLEAKETVEPIEEPAGSISIGKPKIKKEKVPKAVHESDRGSEDSEPPSKRRKFESHEESKSRKASRPSAKTYAKGSVIPPATISPPSSPPPLPRIKRKKKRVESDSPQLPPQPSPKSPNSLFSADGDSHDPNVPEIPPLPVRRAPLHSTIPPAIPPLSHPPLPAQPASLPPPPPSRVNSHAHLAGEPAKAPPTGIPTKQRIAKDALNPLPPKEAVSIRAPPKASNLSRMTTGSSTIMPTGFRKTIPTHANPPLRQDLTHSSLNAIESPPSTRVNFEDVPRADSPPPSVTEEHQEHDLFDITRNVDLELQADPISRISTISEADKFLATVMPSSLADRYPSYPSQIDANDLPPAPLPSRATTIPKIPKKWKWTGSLIVHCAGRDGVHEQFKIVINEEVELRDTKFRFSIALGSSEQLQVQALYDLVDLSSILSVSKSPAYRAQVARQVADENAEAWTTIMKYMIKKQRVALIPLHLDDNLIGHLLLHPSTTNPLPQLTPPPDMHPKSDCFVAWLLPWTLNPDQISREPRLHVIPADPLFERRFLSISSEYHGVMNEPPQNTQQPTYWNELIKHRPLYHHALRVLKFPCEIHKYLRSTSRTWATCFAKGSIPSKVADLETLLLISILQRIKREPDGPGKITKRISIKMITTPESAGMLFMHASALSNLDALPFFLGRLLSSEYVRIYMYGTDPYLPSDFWGVREIYPCGGVVTLTPSAVLRNPRDVLRTLNMIYSHPLWTAYIIPSAIGFIAARSGVQSPGSLSNSVPLSYLLDAISRGEIALLQAPPDRKTFYGPNDQRQLWLRNHIYGAPLSPADALSQGQAAFHSMYSNFTQSEQEKRIEDEVANDLKHIQRQPSMMTNYRRYVAFDGNISGASTRGSIEWISPVKFDFKDQFSDE